MESEIVRKRKSVDSLFYSTSLLENRITSFYSGWISYIAHLANGQELMQASEEVMNTFKNNFLKKSETTQTPLNSSF